MQYACSTRQQVPALRRLWTAVFGDGDPYLDLFFGSRYDPQRCVVCTEEEQVLGMFYLLDCALQTPQGARFPAVYNYALAFDPAVRGRGLSRLLLQYLDTVQRCRGDAASLLKPADRGLFDYYRKNGYTRRFAVDRADCTASMLPAPPVLPVTQADAGTYLALRRCWLQQVSPCWLDWDEDAIGYCLAHERFFGGELLLLGEAAAVFHRLEDGSLLIKELPCADPAQLLPTLSALLAHTGATRCTLLAPVGTLPAVLAPTQEDYGYAKWYSTDAEAVLDALPGYMGLLLD